MTNESNEVISSLRGSRRPAMGWFPPHMHRAFKRLGKEIKNVDLVIEVRDARLPISSSNPELVALLEGKPRLILLNKEDLIPEEMKKEWKSYFANLSVTSLYMDAQHSKNFDAVFNLVEKLLQPFYKKHSKRGMRPPLARILIAGLPNVGKSTLINRLIQKKRQPTAPRPGVTKNVDWITLRDKYLLLDSPGLLLPKLEREEEIFKLGWIGTIPDSTFGELDLATEFVEYLQNMAPSILPDRFEITLVPKEPAIDLINRIGIKRGLLQKGGDVDLARVAVTILKDYRSGNLGRFALEDLPR